MHGRASDGAEQVLAFVQRTGAQRGPHVVAHELVAQVANDRLLRADRERLLARGLEVFVLADVGAEAHDLAAVLLDDPTHRDAGIEATRVGQDDLPNFRHPRKLTQDAAQEQLTQVTIRLEPRHARDVENLVDRQRAVDPRQAGTPRAG